MDRHVYWAPWDEPGLEHLHLKMGAPGVKADGLILRLADGAPLRARYEVLCDPSWRVREVAARVWDPDERALILVADGNGRWSGCGGARLPGLDGCLDVDLTATPFTNTLPIRRLGLAPGQDATLRMAYVRLPALTVEAVEQRYTRLDRGGGHARYLYEGLGTGFRADLEVDDDGLVLDYPGVFRRVWPAPAR